MFYFIANANMPMYIRNSSVLQINSLRIGFNACEYFVSEKELLKPNLKILCSVEISYTHTECNYIIKINKSVRRDYAKYRFFLMLYNMNKDVMLSKHIMLLLYKDAYQLYGKKTALP